MSAGQREVLARVMFSGVKEYFVYFKTRKAGAGAKDPLVRRRTVYGASRKKLEVYQLWHKAF